MQSEVCMKFSKGSAWGILEVFDLNYDLMLFPNKQSAEIFS